MSLAGQRVAVTRAADEAEHVEAALRARGAEAVRIPCITYEPPVDDGPLRRAVEALATYDRVLFTSRTAAARFVQRSGLLTGVNLGCIGATTARWVQAHTEAADVLVPETFRGEAFAEALRQNHGDLKGARFLIPQAAQARGKLQEILEAQGAHVDAVTTYRIERAPEIDAGRLDGVDAFTFMSGRTLQCFLEIFAEAPARAALQRSTVAVVGPVTQAAAERLGVRVDVVAEAATVEGMVEALAKHLDS